MIAIVDPGLTSTNVGDQIIADAVDRHFATPLRRSGQDIELVPMHGGPSDLDRRVLVAANEVVVCGTNLLSSHMAVHTAWQWSRDDINLLRAKLTTLGVGWWQYQRSGVDPVTARWLRALRTPHRAWSVRDEYSGKKLVRAGVKASHTSCPTLWGVSGQSVPRDEANVVVTLTDYNQDPPADARLLQYARNRFERVLYWPQGPGDYRYAKSLPTQGIEILEPTLPALDDALRLRDTAYLGLRLHAGIRALQFGVPALILAIDNRAVEIARSVGLATESRYMFSTFDERMDGAHRELLVPEEAIGAWLAEWDLVYEGEPAR